MKKWIIKGHKLLSGTIKVDGAKNSLVAILPASILTRSIIELENITPIDDTYVIIDILKSLNVKVIYDNQSRMIIDSRNVRNNALISENMRKLRASYYFMGSLLGLFKKAQVLGPGGCKFASRPIDIHLDVFNQMGIDYNEENGVYTLEKGNKRSKEIVLKRTSVGATINSILATVRQRGTTRIHNVANEPEIDDLILFLNKCGANVIRSDNKIIIKGVNKLHACKHSIMKDRIEAGTYLIMGACVGKNLKIEYNESKHLSSLIDILKNSGVDIEISENYLMVSDVDKVNDMNVICDSYPELATDLQQPLSILFTRTNTCSVFEDKIYPSRYTQVNDLNKMGFKMKVNDEKLFVYHSDNIMGSEVDCKDLRGGASLLIAALMGKGETVISNVHHIKRGYFDVLNKLRKIGAIAYEKD